MDEIQKKIGEHWDEMSIKESINRRRWWKSPTVIRHINHRVCGKYLDGRNAGQLDLLRKEYGTIDSALSIGCGFADKEIKLLEMGLVNHFSCYEFQRYVSKREKKLLRPKDFLKK